MCRPVRDFPIVRYIACRKLKHTVNKVPSRAGRDVQHRGCSKTILFISFIFFIIFIYFGCFTIIFYGSITFCVGTYPQGDGRCIAVRLRLNPDRD
jgi:hypothetical protein